MSPQGTGSSAPRSPAYTTTTTAATRPRGTSAADPPLTFNPLNKSAYSGRISPTKTNSTNTNTLGRGGLATGGAISSWSSKADEGKTAPAWNIHQYGYMGGASQGNQGVAFGARRQITSPAPNVPSLAEKEKRLREEAAKLLGEYQTRRASAEREAQDIIANAKAEAERIAVESKAKMEDFVARRTKTAESKIALAEAQALADVRAAAANAAVEAASTILSRSVKGPVADDLLAKGIAEVRAKLN